MGFFHRRLPCGRLGVVAHPQVVLVAGIVWQRAGSSCRRLHDLHATRTSSFPTSVPFFRDWLEFDDKFPENDALYVVDRADQDPTPPAAGRRWTAAADAITARLRGDAATSCSRSTAACRWTSSGRRACCSRTRPTCATTVDEFKQFAPLVKFWGEEAGRCWSPLLGSTPTSDSSPGLHCSAVARRTKTGASSSPAGRQLGHDADRTPTSRWPSTELPDLSLARRGTTRRDLGYYYVPDEPNHVPPPAAGPRLPAPRYYLAAGEQPSGRRPSARVADASAKPFPEFVRHHRPAGPGRRRDRRPPTTTRRIAEIVALSAVFIGLVCALRSLWLALAAEICLAVGIGWTFGWATLAVGELNLLSTVFLIALIGIGMDYLVQMLMRYRQESARRSGRPAASGLRGLQARRGPDQHRLPRGGRGVPRLGLHRVPRRRRPGHHRRRRAAAVPPVRLHRAARPAGAVPGHGRSRGHRSRPLRLADCVEAASRGRGSIAGSPEYRERGTASGRGLPSRRARQPCRDGFVPPALWVGRRWPGHPLHAPRSSTPACSNLQAPNLPSVKLIRKLQTWSAVVLSKDLDQLRQARAGT